MSPAPRDYEAVRAALYALAPRGINLGLGPMREALAAFGDPQRALPAVHVAGTNGKGSVSAMVDAGLRAAGWRTGLYSSPHLHRFAERVRVLGESADDETLARAGGRVLDAVARGEVPSLTFFEATTLLAWEVFREARLDAVVLEVGLGGRLDATSVCAPRATAITRIARDHEALLGDTIAQIAGEKAGILKPGVPCVLGPELAAGEARDAIERVAREVDAPLREAPRARVLGVDGALRARVEIDLAGGALAATLALAGPHQAGNAAVAAGLLELLGVAPAAIARGLESVRWPARLERVDNVLLDAAHNPDGAYALVDAIARLEGTGEGRALVFGASSDKDWRAMLATLEALAIPAERRFFAAAGLRRAEDPAVLAAHAGGRACASVAEALEQARAAVGPEGLVVACGSIFLVAEARAGLLGLAQDPLVGL